MVATPADTLPVALKNRRLALRLDFEERTSSITRDLAANAQKKRKRSAEGSLDAEDMCRMRMLRAWTSSLPSICTATGRYEAPTFLSVLEALKPYRFPRPPKTCGYPSCICTSYNVAERVNGIITACKPYGLELCLVCVKAGKESDASCEYCKDGPAF